MNKEISFSERLPTPEEWKLLRQGTDWGNRKLGEYRMALAGTLFGVCAISEHEAIGMSRVVGDGVLCFQIQDVIVREDCRHQGVGSGLIEETLRIIDHSAAAGATVYLFASAGKEGFYEKFGFRKRPSKNGGAGMFLQIE